MSISKGRKARARELMEDFDPWLKRAFARTGPFTALVVLVEVGEPKVTPVASTFLNVIGDEISWPEIAGLFSGSGKSWNGAAFFPVTDTGGLLSNPQARARLKELEARLADDRLVLNEGAFFDLWGRRMRVDEMPTHH